MDQPTYYTKSLGLSDIEKATEEGFTFFAIGWKKGTDLVSHFPLFFKTTTTLSERLSKWATHFSNEFRQTVTCSGEFSDKTGGVVRMVMNPLKSDLPEGSITMFEYWLIPLAWLQFHRLGINAKTGGVWVEKISIMTNQTTRMETTVQAEQFHSGFLAYKQGELIQVAMPFLSIEEREYMVSGMTPAEWNRLFN